MKKNLILMLSLLILSTLTFAQTKFAYVDVQKIMNESKKGKKLKKDIEQKLEYYKKKAEELEKKAKEIQKQMESPALSEKGKKKKQEELQKIEQEFLMLQQKAQIELNQMKMQAEKQMLKDIERLVEKYAQKNNIDIVLIGGKISAILYADKSLDITDPILKMYNEEKQ
ncbi:MAG: OmpH family outer membrane protein [Aquificae bacterium]|nr:OmpH family outer membrane protein [Aquificota bacterium]